MGKTNAHLSVSKTLNHIHVFPLLIVLALNKRGGEMFHLNIFELPSRSTIVRPA